MLGMQVIVSGTGYVHCLNWAYAKLEVAWEQDKSNIAKVDLKCLTAIEFAIITQLQPCGRCHAIGCMNWQCLAQNGIPMRSIMRVADI